MCPCHTPVHAHRSNSQTLADVVQTEASADHRKSLLKEQHELLLAHSIDTVKEESWDVILSH